MSHCLRRPLHPRWLPHPGTAHAPIHHPLGQALRQNYGACLGWVHRFDRAIVDIDASRHNATQNAKRKVQKLTEQKMFMNPLWHQRVSTCLRTENMNQMEPNPRAYSKSLNKGHAIPHSLPIHSAGPPCSMLMKLIFSD